VDKTINLVVCAICNSVVCVDDPVGIDLVVGKLQNLSLTGRKYLQLAYAHTCYHVIVHVSKRCLCSSDVVLVLFN
jgi:hypothetical protein